MSETFKLTCMKCGRSMTLEQRLVTRQDTTIDECALCDEERAAPQPITFRDEKGQEWRVLADRIKDGCPRWLRDATPADLARAGYEPRLPPTMRLLAVLSALTALEKLVRFKEECNPVENQWHDIRVLLEAIDEAREKKP